MKKKTLLLLVVFIYSVVAVIAQREYVPEQEKKCISGQQMEVVLSAPSKTNQTLHQDRSHLQSNSGHAFFVAKPQVPIVKEEKVNGLIHNADQPLISGEYADPVDGTDVYPFLEGFENSALYFPPLDWVVFESGTGTVNDWGYADNVLLVYDGTYSAAVEYEDVATGTAIDWLVTNKISLTGDGHQLEFYQRDGLVADFGTTFSIRVSTASQTDPADFTIIEDWDESDMSTTYTLMTVDLGSYSGLEVYIAFVMEQDDGDFWFIDNVVIRDNVKNWVGTTSDWATAENWNPVGVPNADNSIVIQSGYTDPLVDEFAGCNHVTIESSAKLTVNNGGRLNLDGSMRVYGEFEMNTAAICAMDGNLYSVSGSTVDMNGGTLDFVDWQRDDGYLWAEGNIQLSGGTINAAGTVYFSTVNLSGTMDGPINFNVGEMIYINTAGFSSANVTDGTVTLTASGDSPYGLVSPTAVNPSIAYNLVINNSGERFDLNQSNFSHGVQINGDFTINAGTVYTTWYDYYENTSFSVSGAFSMASGATFVHGDIPAANFSFGSSNLNSASNYIYVCNQAQTLLSGLSYGNLATVGQGTCTTDGQVFVYGNFLAAGDVDLNDNDFSISGNATIVTGATLHGGGGLVSVNGNWTDNGTFSYETSTVSFAGEGNSDIGGSPGLNDDLQTQFSSENLWAGCYFDITASGNEDLTIHSYDFNTDITGEVSVQVWYYPLGSYSGHEISTSGWVQQGSVYLINGQGMDTPTHFDPGESVTVPSGSTFGFYISCWDLVSTTGNLLYSDDGLITYSDTYITLDAGSAGNGLVGGGSTATTSGRNWDGRVYYSTPTAFLPFYDLTLNKVGKAGLVSLFNHVDVNNDLTINANNSMNVNPAKYLNVDGMLSNNAGNGGLVIHSDINGTGNLKHNSNSVPATIERYTTGSSNLNDKRYHLVSVPLEASNSPLSGLFMWSYLFSFNESAYDWIWWGEELNQPMDVTEGYMIYYPNLGGNNPADTTYVIAGTINNGSFSASVGYTAGDHPGLNLVPNPYPSPIDWDASSGWTKTNINNSLWIWSAANGNYASYINGTATNGASQFIPVGQAFFVEASAASPALGMNNDVRVFHDQDFLKSADEVVEGALKMKTYGNGYGDEIVIRFHDQATDHFDADYDARKMHGLKEAPQLYTLMDDNEQYSINALPYTSEQFSIPIAYEMTVAGVYGFIAEGLGSIDQAADIYLEDTQTGVIQDLRKNNHFEFVHNPENFPMRFKLHFNGVTSIEETATVSDQIYFANGQLFLNIQSFGREQVVVEIFSVSGQRLFEKEIHPNGLTTVNVENMETKGIYLIRLTSIGRSITRKVAN